MENIQAAGGAGRHPAGAVILLVGREPGLRTGKEELNSEASGSAGGKGKMRSERERMGWAGRGLACDLSTMSKAKP